MGNFVVHLRPDPRDTIPPMIRLRAALKRLLRDHRLRAVSVAEIADAPRSDIAADIIASESPTPQIACKRNGRAKAHE